MTLIRSPPTATTRLMKFVSERCLVGVGGDRIKVIGGAVYLNGKKQKEPFARLSRDCELCNKPDEITIPKGYYFMMGDHRENSDDSRVWGAEPRDEILGIARFRYWPLDRLGTL